MLSYALRMHTHLLTTSREVQSRGKWLYDQTMSQNTTVRERKHVLNTKGTKPMASSSWGWLWVSSWNSSWPNCFNSLWVYFQGNLETAKPRIQFDMYKRLILWGCIWSFCFSASLLYLQAPDLVKGRLLVCFLCLGHLVFPFPSTFPLMTADISGPQRARVGRASWHVGGGRGRLSQKSMRKR